MPYYSIFKVFIDDNSIKPYDIFHDNIEMAVCELENIIQNYGKPSIFDPNQLSTPTEFDYNVWIYQVSVWKNLETHQNKIIPIRKVTVSPELHPYSDFLSKYFKLCFEPNMTIAKLYFEIFGKKNKTKEELDAEYKLELDRIITDINTKFCTLINNNDNFYRLNSIIEDEWNNSYMTSFHFAGDVKKHFEKIGYYVTEINDGCDVNLYFFDKIYVNSFIIKFNDVLINNLTNGFPNKEYKRYLFEKFVAEENINDKIASYLKEYYWF
jgi:hypothetical protein